LSPRNTAASPRKNLVKTVFPASNAVTIVAGYAVPSGSADVMCNSQKICTANKDGKEFLNLTAVADQRILENG